MRWQRYTLKNPYLFQGQLRESKESLILTFENEGEKIISECSVFPGLHCEDHQYYEELAATLPKLFKPLKPFENLSDILQQTKKFSSLAANLLFAYESALVQYWGAHQLLPSSWQQSFNRSLLKITIQDLLTDPSVSCAPRAQTVKCKIGREKNVLSDITLFQKLCSLYPDKKWRLDANNAYVKKDLELWANTLTHSQRDSIDYFENPCLDPADWSESFPFPLALETGLETKKSWWQQGFQLKAIVHKPALTLGFFQTCKFIQEANTEVILSSTFEGPHGLRDLLTLASFLKLKNPQGLGTLEQLKLAEPVTGLTQSDNELSLVRKNFHHLINT